MNIEAYLKRINYTGSLEPTAETLRDLQVAHLKTVPFENLSIHAGEPIVLEEEALFQKIVEWPPKVPPKGAENYKPPSDI